MLDLSHIPDTPGIDIQKFYGSVGTTLTEWQTWRKPRGCKFVYMIGVGGGSSGGCGVNTSTTSGGGAGGGSGSQTSLYIPAFLLPDILYIQAGQGGAPQNTSGVIGAAGTSTLVAYEPYTATTARMTVLFANPGAVTGTAATTTAGGAAGTAAASATISDMILAGKGRYTFFAGMPGAAGGSSTGTGSSVTLSTSGLMVSGGSGGAGDGANSGGNITGITGSPYLPTVSGGIAASGSTPGKNGSSFIAPYFLMNYGGSGGGGGNTTAGGTAGAGGNASPGCGGGGSGGATTTNPTVLSGAGGPGFVYIFSW